MRLSRMKSIVGLVLGLSFIIDGSTEELLGEYPRLAENNRQAFIDHYKRVFATDHFNHTALKEVVCQAHQASQKAATIFEALTYQTRLQQKIIQEINAYGLDREKLRYLVDSVAMWDWAAATWVHYLNLDSSNRFQAHPIVYCPDLGTAFIEPDSTRPVMQFRQWNDGVSRAFELIKARVKARVKTWEEIGEIMEWSWQGLIPGVDLYNAYNKINKINEIKKDASALAHRLETTFSPNLPTSWRLMLLEYGRLQKEKDRLIQTLYTLSEKINTHTGSDVKASDQLRQFSDLFSTLSKARDEQLRLYLFDRPVLSYLWYYELAFNGLDTSWYSDRAKDKNAALSIAANLSKLTTFVPYVVNDRVREKLINVTRLAKERVGDEEDYEEAIGLAKLTPGWYRTVEQLGKPEGQ